jgi:N-acylglucosamine 2-epimerase
MELTTLRRIYQRTLLDNILPFWEKNAMDANGGINTCIGDDGTVISRDRWSWSQWRALWVFSKLGRGVEVKQQWIDIASGLYQFTTNHGPLDSGHWPLLMDGDGNILRGYESIYSDSFAILGLVEYWNLTGNDEALELASNTFRVVQNALASDTEIPAWPYPIPAGCLPHGLSMIFSLAYHELAQATGDSSVRAAALQHHDRVIRQYLRPDRGIVLEWMNVDGSEAAPPLGSAICPGHAIESMWFQIHIALVTGDQQVIKTAVDAIRLHLELGWDKEFGGLLLAVDADGRKEVGWPHADMKLWWPHTEALYATLLAYEITGEDWFLKWHEKIHNYSFTHYPIVEHGEWRQRLDRRGFPVNTVVALPVKDPFHLPRALILCIEALQRLEGKACTQVANSN